ncbi:MAG: hypothetical protein KVP17_002385 [Porospora cf. gigantea B]|uniref:uncharacterized protein n=1 Tax=Porospora cf. gigantea B TaxID=2853592 RepID=UPI003571AF9A|nr:MAG: hypothetical protein KVP17_002385 [Porospora cf. gigantea B]
MSLVCSISGECPEEPVLVPRTGLIYEKRLLRQYLEENNGLCPSTGDPIDLADAIAVNVDPVVRPRPPKAASVGGLLGLLQNEWDTLMQETFVLRQHLDQIRSQLSQSLYQHEAACRVIARLQREKDALQAQSAALQQEVASLKNTGFTPSEQGLPETFLQEIEAASVKLTQSRRSRGLQDVCPRSKWAKIESGGRFQTHQAAASVCGVTGVKVVLNESISASPVSVSSGRDGSATLFDLNERQVIASLIGHTRAASEVVVHSKLPIVATGSADRTIRVWSGRKTQMGKMSFKSSHVLRTHTGEILSLDLHTLGSLLLSSATDRTMSIHDLDSGALYKVYKGLGFNCNRVQVHPDGVIFGAASQGGTLDIWDIREAVCKAKLEAEAAVADLDFNQNGYYLASGDVAGNVKIWDLRKSSVVQSLALGQPISGVSFDYSGQYLAASAAEGIVKIYNYETKHLLSEVNEIHLGSNPCRVGWGPRAQWLLAGSVADSAVELWRPECEAERLE